MEKCFGYKGVRKGCANELSTVFVTLNHDLSIVVLHDKNSCTVWQKSWSNWLKVTWIIVGKEQWLTQALVAEVILL